MKQPLVPYALAKLQRFLKVGFHPGNLPHLPYKRTQVRKVIGKVFLVADFRARSRASW
jgi:hypothetical protein